LSAWGSSLLICSVCLCGLNIAACCYWRNPSLPVFIGAKEGQCDIMWREFLCEDLPVTDCLRGTLAGLLACLALPALAQSATPDLSGRDPHWIKDSAKNCWAADPDPQAGETVTWTGACAGGLVKGQGTLTWYLNGRLFGRDEGAFRNGELFGHGRITRVNGASFEGEFPGKGVITLRRAGRRSTLVSIKEAVGWSIEQAPPSAR